jgi:hypothetical protein
MGTGRNNKLVGQTGEYLVAAELSRRNLIATTFTGNVPHYDIIASDEEGKHVSVQVKASRFPSWQFGDITQFCEISFDKKHQIVGKPKRSPVKRLIVVFVMIDAYGADQFYILTWRRLRDLMVKKTQRLSCKAWWEESPKMGFFTLCYKGKCFKPIQR